jgi:hypothetical protein
LEEVKSLKRANEELQNDRDNYYTIVSELETKVLTLEKFRESDKEMMNAQSREVTCNLN